jgi:hypothetical protein
VIAGRVERDGQLGGHFAWVAQRPEDALEFMRAAMRSDGWTERSQVAVLADGADGLADLVNAVSPNSCRSILDWFHISMRLRPIEQMAPKITAALKLIDAGIGEFISKRRLAYGIRCGTDDGMQPSSECMTSIMRSR